MQVELTLIRFRDRKTFEYTFNELLLNGGKVTETLNNEQADAYIVLFKLSKTKSKQINPSKIKETWS